MPVTPEAKKRFLSALRAARPIESRAMFGGIGVWLDEAFVAAIDDDRLYLKVDTLTEGRYLERGMEGWVYDPLRKPMPYRELPADVLDDPETCGEWLDAARESALRLKGRTKARPPRRVRAP